LDVVYWHVNDSVEQAQVLLRTIACCPSLVGRTDLTAPRMLQDAFDQLCAFDSSDPLANFYFTEVGDSLERLHQVSREHAQVTATHPDTQRAEHPFPHKTTDP